MKTEPSARSTFKIYAEYHLPLSKNRQITKSIRKAFLNNLPSELLEGYGVYVYYRKAANNRVPFYIGKANGVKGFKQEILDPTKVLKYEHAMHPTEDLYTTNGNYYFSFYVLQRRVLKDGLTKAKLSKQNISDIRSLEKELINQAYMKNVYVQNIHDAKSSIPKWEIKGLAQIGRKSKDANVHISIFK